MQNCVCDGDLLVEPPSHRFPLLIFSLWLSRGTPSTSVGHCVRAPLQQRYPATPQNPQTHKHQNHDRTWRTSMSLKLKTAQEKGPTWTDGQTGGRGSSGCSRLQGIKKVLLLDLAQLQLLPQTLKRIISRRGSKKTC